MFKNILYIFSLFIAPTYSSAYNNFSTLSDKVFKLTLKAHKNVKKINKNVTNITMIVDYTLPSSQPRLWVLDMKNKKQLYSIHVSHGKNSGFNKAIAFSNKLNSYKSSIGIFITKNIYTGKHGMSLNLLGLEKGYNDLCFKRRVVIHGSKYVSKKFIKKHGRPGRSLGCFAIDPTIVKDIIKIMGKNSLVISYTNNKNWLKKSVFFR